VATSFWAKRTRKNGKLTKKIKKQRNLSAHESEFQRRDLFHAPWLGGKSISKLKALPNSALRKGPSDGT